MDVYVIICVCIAIGGWLLHQAISNNVPKEEWFAYCGIYCIILIIVGLEWRSLLYFYIACLSLMLVCSLFLNYADYKKTKTVFEKKKRVGCCVICAELTDEKHPTNSSMTVWSDGEALGNLLPYNKSNYEFAYYSSGLKREFVMKNNSPECLLRGRNYNYSLCFGDRIYLKIEKEKHNLVVLKATDFCLELPIYKRHIVIHEKTFFELHLFYEGFLLSCKENERDIFICFSYYAWLIIFGERRKSD